MLLLAFALTLVAAVLVSALAERTVLSTAVLFLLAGAAAQLVLRPDVRAIVGPLAEAALVIVLFTDGAQLTTRELRQGWRLPGRALLLGLPLTVAGNALLGRYVAGLGWGEAFLVGAALSPTDPVLAAAVVGAREVPRRLRHLLNVESGLNDGLALPLVIVLLAVLRPERAPLGAALGEVALGVALGVALPLAVLRLERSRFFGAAPLYEPLSAVAAGLLAYAAAAALHANAFLGVFAAGVVVATTAPRIARAFARVGEVAAELAKLAAIFVFGAVLSPRLLAEIPLSGYAYALLVLLVVRPAALALALVGGGLSWREWVAAAWFGPKGFSSVVYGLLILASGLPRARALAHLVALVVAGSILAHSSTDVLVARWFRRDQRRSSGGATRPNATSSARS
ncbi:cation:proton antiporter domain-containing protein [Anaeromyxobacter diazotrophicus]|uniref:Peptidase n=1 Tax=Anaeromyxobacter diazotrophicus TaxID=2590199 RepID=A0A7I9VSA3_9BACT|nr:cation:proton antiporter [Anaeromyxobacter diazotrophicus]GEJ59098.1 peptidase [Anaeromyxobacter diazotrophicus]